MQRKYSNHRMQNKNAMEEYSHLMVGKEDVINGGGIAEYKNVWVKSADELPR